MAVTTTYAGARRGTAKSERSGREVPLDCPPAGSTDALSPTELVEAGLGGCLLLAMDTFAERHGVDLRGATAEVRIATDARLRFTAVEVHVTVPTTPSPRHRAALQRAAAGCPVKQGLREDLPVTLRFAWG